MLYNHCLNEKCSHALLSDQSQIHTGTLIWLPVRCWSKSVKLGLFLLPGNKHAKLSTQFWKFSYTAKWLYYRFGCTYWLLTLLPSSRWFSLFTCNETATINSQHHIFKTYKTHTQKKSFHIFSVLDNRQTLQASGLKLLISEENTIRMASYTFKLQLTMKIEHTVTNTDVSSLIWIYSMLLLTGIFLD
jgi:hypothetical protein